MKKQKSGLYRTAVTVAGQKVWISAHTKSELEDKKREVRERLVRGVPDKPITFAELVVKWWKEVKAASGLRPGTQYMYMGIIEKWILPNIDSRMLAQAVRRSDMQNIVNVARKSLKQKSCSHIKMILSETCKYGMELGFMAADYAHNVIVRPDDEPKVRRPAIPDAVVQKMLEVAEKPFLQTLAVMYYCGLRKGEAIALTWGDVDFEHCVIHISKSFDKHVRTIGPTKTANSVRDVFMPDDLIAILKPLREMPGARFGVTTSAMLEYRWVKTLYDAGYATHVDGKPNDFYYSHYDFEYSPHQLRHTYAMHLHAAGVDSLTASRLMGHSSYSVTADVYTEIEQTKMDGANRDLERTFAKS